MSSNPMLEGNPTVPRNPMLENTPAPNPMLADVAPVKTANPMLEDKPPTINEMVDDTAKLPITIGTKRAKMGKYYKTKDELKSIRGTVKAQVGIAKMSKTLPYEGAQELAEFVSKNPEVISNPLPVAERGEDKVREVLSPLLEGKFAPGEPEGPALNKPWTSPVTALGKAIDPFYRGIGGVAKAAHDELEYQAKLPEAKTPADALAVMQNDRSRKTIQGESAPDALSTIEGSVMGENPQYISGLMQHSAEDVKGSPLTFGERLASGFAGLVTELAVPLPLPKAASYTKNLTRQLSKALPEVNPAELGRAADLIAQSSSHPERLASAARIVRKIGGEGAEQSFNKAVGWGGERLGQGRFMEKIIPRTEKVEGQISRRGATASALPEFIRPAVGAARWGGDLPTGAKQISRSAESYRGSLARPAERAAKNIRKGLGKDRGREWMYLEDMKGEHVRTQKALQAAGTEEEKAQIALDYQTKLDRAGAKLGRPITDADISAGFQFSTGEKGAKEMAAANQVKGIFAYLRKVEREHGLSVNEIEYYIPRKLTKEAKALLSLEDAGGVGAKFGPGKHRQAGVGLAGTGRAEFVDNLEEAVLERIQSHAIAVSGAEAETNLLKQYGKEITHEGKLSGDYLRQMQSEGLQEYAPRLDKRLAGKTYAIDKTTYKYLDRMTNPQIVNGLWEGTQRIVNKVMAPWKAAATVFRPGFVSRNLMSNGVTYWVFGGDVSELGRAANFLRKIGKEPGFGAASTMSKADQELLALCNQNKILSGGFFPTEIQKTGGFSVNPLNPRFAWQGQMGALNQSVENTFRVALFKSELKAGKPAWEAADSVAKAFFNYDELSRAGQAARSVFPFFTWTYKNWGQQLSNLIERPAKMFKQVRALEGSQQLDPLSAQDKRSLQFLPNPELTYVVPGIRGEKETAKVAGKEVSQDPRMLFQMANFLPMYGLDQLRKPGETLKQMANPLVQGAAGWLGGEGQAAPQPWGAYRQPAAPENLRNAPTYISSTMNNIKEKEPGIWKTLSKVFLPKWDETIYQKKRQEARSKHLSPKEAEEYAEQNTPIVGYKVDQGLIDAVGKFIPQYGTINRLTRVREDQMYDAIGALISGIKARPYGFDAARKDQEVVLKELQDFQTKLKSRSEIQGQRMRKFK